MFSIGCHLSSSGGFLAMGETARRIGATTFQFFTRNPRGSRAKAIDPADAAALRGQYAVPSAHGAYLSYALGKLAEHA